MAFLRGDLRLSCWWRDSNPQPLRDLFFITSYDIIRLVSAKQSVFLAFSVERDTLSTRSTGRCGGTVYALVSKTSPARVEGSNLSTGITLL